MFKYLKHLYKQWKIRRFKAKLAREYDPDDPQWVGCYCKLPDGRVVYHLKFIPTCDYGTKNWDEEDRPSVLASWEKD